MDKLNPFRFSLFTHENLLMQLQLHPSYPHNKSASYAPVTSKIESTLCGFTIPEKIRPIPNNRPDNKAVILTIHFFIKSQ